MKQTILLTGGSGLVGSRLKEFLANRYSVFAPSRSELDITKRNVVFRFVAHRKPDAIIHAAAFTDVGKAERQRENKHAQCWIVNVEGTRHIQEAADESHAFHIFISTGSVFAGTKKHPGPFIEDDEPPSDPSKLSWYGWTKRCAEKVLDGAIIRISHPVKKDGPGVERDYIHNLLNLYQKGRLYPLFTDQFFPITWIDDLANIIDMLIKKPRRGIYHVASPDLTSPYELIKYIVKTTKLRGDLKNAVRKASMEEFLKTVDHRMRFTRYCAIDSRKTSQKYGIKFRSWKAVVESIIDS